MIKNNEFWKAFSIIIFSLISQFGISQSSSPFCGKLFYKRANDEIKNMPVSGARIIGFPDELIHSDNNKNSTTTKKSKIKDRVLITYSNKYGSFDFGRSIKGFDTLYCCIIKKGFSPVIVKIHRQVDEEIELKQIGNVGFKVKIESERIFSLPDQTSYNYNLSNKKIDIKDLDFYVVQMFDDIDQLKTIPSTAYLEQNKITLYLPDNDEVLNRAYVLFENKEKQVQLKKIQPQETESYISTIALNTNLIYNTYNDISTAVLIRKLKKPIKLLKRDEEITIANYHFKNSISISLFHEDSYSLIHENSDNFLKFENCVFTESISINGQFKGKMVFKDCYFFNEIIFFNYIHHGSLQFQNCVMGTGLTFDSVFIKNGKIEHTTLPQIVSLRKIFVDEYFSFNDVSKQNLPYPCEIEYIGFVQAEKMHQIFCENLEFSIKSSESGVEEDNLQEIQSTYMKLLSKAKNDGYMKSYEIIHRKYLEAEYLNHDIKVFGQIQNWLQSKWWGYGYNKEYIILNTIIIFFIFVLINSFFLERLSGYVYEDNKIYKLVRNNETVPIIKAIKRFPLSVYYTSIIFFVVTISLKKLRYAENLHGLKWLWLIYLGVIYVSGLVCLGYLANFIITSGG